MLTNNKTIASSVYGANIKNSIFIGGQSGSSSNSTVANGIGETANCWVTNITVVGSAGQYSISSLLSVRNTLSTYNIGTWGGFIIGYIGISNSFVGPYGTNYALASPMLLDSAWYENYVATQWTNKWGIWNTGTNFVLGPTGVAGLAPKARSPLINAGLLYDSGSDKDYAGNARTIGGGVDVGAYEYFLSPIFFQKTHRLITEKRP